MKDFLLLLFCIAGGLTVSGIVANVYRLLVGKKDEKAEKDKKKDVVYCAVMVLAGPSVLLENATASFRAKKCSRIAYGLAVALTGYWAFALGLLAISIGMNL